MILLDTHVLVWLSEGETILGAEARAKADLALGEEVLGICAISFWEVAMLARKGRLRLERSLESWREALLRLGLVELPVDGEAGIRAAGLEDFQADPADRLIVATALLRGAVLMTADERILRWSGPLQRHDART